MPIHTFLQTSSTSQSQITVRLALRMTKCDSIYGKYVNQKYLYQSVLSVRKWWIVSAARKFFRVVNQFELIISEFGNAIFNHFVSSYVGWKLS